MVVFGIGECTVFDLTPTKLVYENGKRVGQWEYFSFDQVKHNIKRS